MHFDASLPPVPLAQVTPIARAAEALGFDALWTSETQHDPFFPCVLIAEHTQRLHMGTAIAVSFARSPATLAYKAWDLAQYSQGRFILGLGTQVKAHIERRFGMPWPESPVGKLREQILAIRAFWQSWQTGAPLNLRGEYYRLTLMSPFFNPGPIEYPSIPIYIAGVNTGLARLAGETCQGFHVHPFHSPRYLREVIVPAIEEGLRRADRQRQEIQISVTAFVATSEQEKAFARSQIAFYASTPSYHSVMALYGWQDLAERLSAHAARGEWGEMPALISDEVLNEFCLIAPEADLAAALRERYQGLADRLTLYTPFIPGEKDAFWSRLIRELNG
ncbi:MAG: TIGR03617 family F420-dependent LLM class oxidoreductase [Chloroflexi bacterium]|nr:TIGR03617 family F420-dependent LLM class oxidoreductase [Chloroflexota bacterium]